MIAVPLYLGWGESVRAVRADWVPQIAAMSIAYLALATFQSLSRTRRNARDLCVLILVGIALFGGTYLLLRLRSDIPRSRFLAVTSMVLGIAMAALPVLLQNRRWFAFLAPAALALALTASSLLGGSDRIPLQVMLGTRSVSKLPFVIAEDLGLYDKHGLDVALWMPPPEFPGGIEVRRREPTDPDIVVDGQTPMMVRMATDARFARRIAIAGGDCVVRTHIIGSRKLSGIEDLLGKRLGINLHRATTGFVARLLAQRMGWDPMLDLSILENGRDVEALEQGLVDAIVANERSYALLVEQDYPILADTREWNESIAGNSVMVEPDWLQQPGNRDAALRFLKATAEAIAVFHQQPDEAIRVMVTWHGTDPDLARTVHARGATLPRKPFPCYDGIRKTLELYDSHALRRHTAGGFYDDSLIRELDESGFLDGLYR